MEAHHHQVSPGKANSHVFAKDPQPFCPYLCCTTKFGAQSMAKKSKLPF